MFSTRVGQQPLVVRRCLVGCIMALALPVAGTGDVQSVTQTLSVNVMPSGTLTIPPSVSLQAADAHFGGNLSGTLTVSFWSRTSDGGGGSITVQGASDFSSAGGPSIANITYMCSGATLGTGCSGNQTLAISTQTPLVTIPGGTCTGGGSACSTQQPNTVLLTFTGPNKPHFKTGTYSALITFTITTF
jgi:hypothetical protein